ncbi:oxidative DNA demethylase [Thoreauomyces humboldtii]|nr:oxidative DNA demethylase [Thoreauomyces humboldtii]
MQGYSDGSLSRQELRTRLFETLRSKGVADKLKSQLRAKIVAELKLRIHRPTEQSDPALEASRGRLLNQVLDSLVIGYLRSRGLDFTLSVFLPESGCSDGIRVLTEEDVMQALHLDHRTPFYHALRGSMEGNTNETLLVNLVTGLIHVADLGMVETGCQTELEVEDLIESRVRETDRRLDQRTQDQSRLHAVALEERMLRFQREIENRLQREAEQRFTEFRSIELAQMRIEERRRHEREIEVLRAESSQKIDELRESGMKAAEGERARLAEREKMMEQLNLDLRQRLLEENNRAVMKEATLRTEADLMAQQTRLERDAVQRRYEEAAAQLELLRGLKDKYSEKLQEAMAMYKIDTNKEYQTMVSRVEIEKAKVEAERTLLRERIAVAEVATNKKKDALEQLENVKTSLSDAHREINTLKTSLADSERLVRELQAQAAAVKTSGALEFEIHNLREQLTDAEKMAEKRQEDYQSLLKSFMVPDTQKELAKCRRSEANWQRECQQLVMKLDVEINRNETLHRKCEEKILQIKQLKRDNADLRLVLHQAKEVQTSAGSFQGPGARSLRSDALPDPYNLDDMYATRLPDVEEILAGLTPASRSKHEDWKTDRSQPSRDWRQEQQIAQVPVPELTSGPATPVLDRGVAARVEAGALGLPLLEELTDGIAPALPSTERRQEVGHELHPQRQAGEPDRETSGAIHNTADDPPKRQSPAPPLMPPLFAKSSEPVAAENTVADASRNRREDELQRQRMVNARQKHEAQEREQVEAREREQAEAARREVEKQERECEEARQRADKEQKEKEEAARVQAERAETTRLRRLARERELEEIEERERRERESKRAKDRTPPSSIHPSASSEPLSDVAPQHVSPAVDPTLQTIAALEEDPEMQKYIAVVTARKLAEQKEKRTSGTAAGETSDAVRLPGNIEPPSFQDSSQSSHSEILDYGAGDTGDEQVSAPAFEDTTEDDGW